MIKKVSVHDRGRRERGGATWKRGNVLPRIDKGEGVERTCSEFENVVKGVWIKLESRVILMCEDGESGE